MQNLCWALCFFVWFLFFICVYCLYNIMNFTVSFSYMYIMYFDHIQFIFTHWSSSSSQKVFLLLFCLFSFNSRFHIWKKTCHICLSESGLFHFTWWSPIPFIFLQMNIVSFFLWQNETAWCSYTTFSLSTYLLMGTSFLRALKIHKQAFFVRRY
jgi:hypothetical protein